MSLFFTNLDYDSEDRYDFAKFMRFTDNFDPITSTMINEVQSLEQEGSLLVRGEESRPDLISYEVYGTTQYWWLLLLYNQISYTENFKSGDVIKYPSLDSIEELYFSLKSRETVNTL